jgi:hypothetical protein
MSFKKYIFMEFIIIFLKKKIVNLSAHVEWCQKKKSLFCSQFVLRPQIFFFLKQNDIHLNHFTV